jgi:hypothetical protein
MEFGWDVFFTLLIAVYGAILSTYSVLSRRQEQRPKLKVLLKYGITIDPLSQARSPLKFILSALNTGKKTITLDIVGLILPTKDKKYFDFYYPNSPVHFPYDLLEGKSCSVYIELKELANDLKQEGYSGKISLKGYYKDAIDRKYESKSVKFDIEKS